MSQTLQQTGLFDDEHADIGALFDHLDHVPANEIMHKWPSTLAEIIDILTCELVRQGENAESAKSKAAKLVGVMAHYFGGKSVYLPTGDVLKDALRNVQIYQAFDGRNVSDLVSKYRLSESHIYAILREQRALLRKRYQRDLFET